MLFFYERGTPVGAGTERAADQVQEEGGKGTRIKAATEPGKGVKSDGDCLVQFAGRVTPRVESTRTRG